MPRRRYSSGTGTARPLLPVALDVLAGIAAVGTIPPRLGLLQDDGQDRRRTVRRRRHRMQRAEPALHLLAVDLRDRPAREEGQDLLAEIVAVDGERARLPASAVAREDLLGDGLETARRRIPPLRYPCRRAARPAWSGRGRARRPRSMTAASPTIFQTRWPRCWLWMKYRFLPEGMMRTPYPFSSASLTLRTVLRGRRVSTRPLGEANGCHDCGPDQLHGVQSRIRSIAPGCTGNGEIPQSCQIVSTVGAPRCVNP